MATDARLEPGTPAHTAVCHALATVIADISERHYAAGWMDGIERTLWRDTRLGDGHYQGYTEGDHRATLKALSELIDGWVAWSDAPPYWRYVPRSEWESEHGD